MDACDFYVYVCYVQTTAAFVPVLLAAWNWKFLTRTQRWFGVYFGLYSLLNLATLLLALRGTNNHFLLNSIGLLDLCFGLFWFPILLKNKRIGSIAYSIGWILIVGWCYQVLFINHFLVLADSILMARSAYLTMFAVVALAELFLEGDPDSEVSSQPNFFLLLGLAFVHSIACFHSAFSSELMNYSQDIACNFESIVSLIEVAAFVLYAYCFGIQKRRWNQ